VGKKTGPNPTDRAKEGVKRSLLTEANGIPIGLEVAPANRHDCKLVRTTLESLAIRPPEPTAQEPPHLCQDKGYDTDEVRELDREFGYTAHICSRGQEAQALKQDVGFKARRWVVERTYSCAGLFG
jgi:transposase